MVVYVDTYNIKFTVWTYHPWVCPTDMSSQSSRNSKKDATILAWEPLTEKSRKGLPQIAEQRIDKRQTTSGKKV
jgi:hypothetical protein